MKELVETLVKYLVDQPEQVRIAQVEGERGIVFEVRTAQSDLGKVIGRGGRIANAVRTIVKAAATKQGKKVNVEILDED
jgi:hypothetical protein